MGAERSSCDPKRVLLVEPVGALQLRCCSLQHHGCPRGLQSGPTAHAARSASRTAVLSELSRKFNPNLQEAAPIHARLEPDHVGAASAHDAAGARVEAKPPLACDTVAAQLEELISSRFSRAFGAES